MIEIKVLGPFAARYNGHDIMWQPMQELLIQALLVSGRGLESHELADMLWDRPASGADQTKLGHISRVRKPVIALGGSKDDLLKTVKLAGGGFAYQLADDLIIDAVSFRKLVSAGVQALCEFRLREAVTQLAAALRLWRGDPLPGVNRRWWALGYVEQLEEVHKTAVIKRLEGRIGLGHHRDAVSELKMLARRWPDEDDIWKLLVTGLYRSGRLGEAGETCRHVIDAKRNQGHDERQFLDLQQDVLSGTLPLDGPTGAHGCRNLSPDAQVDTYKVPRPRGCHNQAHGTT